MNDPLEHATGLEKWEMTQMKAGNDVSFTPSMKLQLGMMIVAQ